MAKMTRNEILKRKYALVMNAYQDSNVAKKASQWGWERLERELGIAKPSQKRFKKGYELKDYTKDTKYHKRMQLRKVEDMKEKGFTPEALRKYKRKSYNKINKNKHTLVIDGKFYELFWPETRKERYDTWRWWSNRNEKNMPDVIRYEMATQVNRNYNKQLNHKTGEYEPNIHEDNNRFGFGIVYFMYVDEKDLQDALKIIEPDKSERAQYKYKDPSYKQNYKSRRRRRR